MYFMSDPQALHVTRNVIPGKLGMDLHLHRVHIPLVINALIKVTLSQRTVAGALNNNNRTTLLSPQSVLIVT